MIDYSVVLEDDETETGGTSFCGETLGDFLESVGMKGETDLDKINLALKDCGIKEIEL